MIATRLQHDCTWECAAIPLPLGGAADGALASPSTLTRFFSGFALPSGGRADSDAGAAGDASSALPPPTPFWNHSGEGVECSVASAARSSARTIALAAARAAARKAFRNAARSGGGGTARTSGGAGEAGGRQEGAARRRSLRYRP